MGYDKIVYIINGGEYGNGYISISKMYDGSYCEGSASCGLQDRSVTAIKKEHRGKDVKFIIVKLPSLPKQQKKKRLTI